MLSLGHFEWDEEKATANFLKHKIAFDESVTSFFDTDFLRMPDEKHSLIERRYLGIGSSNKGNLLVTVFTERVSNIRIISSRKANKKEREVYEKRKEK